MTSALLCFASTYIAVFALGLQSLNVNQGHYFAAAATSLLIGLGHIALYKFMPGANLADVAGYLAGGVAGITTSMWFHRRVKVWWANRAARQRLNRAILRRGQVPPKAPPPRPACVCGIQAGEGCPRLVCERYSLDEHADVFSGRLH